MFAKILQFYTIIILYFFRKACVQSISITSIVRFECSSCKPHPSSCCIGTLILPNVVLTTSYCAKTCQYVDKIPIKNVFVHPHYKNYARGRNFVIRNDIALVLIGFETRHKRKIVKLSALDNESLIGYRALIPIMDNAKPRLQVTTIQRCSKEGSRTTGYYVCSSNVFTRKSLKVCQERQEQGVPLLIDDRILGITAAHSEEKCLLPQRIFTRVGPALSWIGSTVKNLGYEEYDRDIQSQQACTTVKKFLLLRTQTNTSYMPYIDRQSATRVTNITNTQISSTPHLELGDPLITTEKEKPVAIDHKLGNHNVSVKNIRAPVIRADHKIHTKGGVSTGTTAITFIPLHTSTRRHQTSSSSTLKTVESKSETSSITSSTNIMDWFNAKMREKIKNKPPPFLIVGSSTLVSSHRTTKFIDLT